MHDDEERICPECGDQVLLLNAQYVYCPVHGMRRSLKELRQICDDPFLEPFRVLIDRIMGANPTS